MEKDIKKALYENIMSSVAKEVKKVLNESDELADKQSRLKDLKQEYASLTSKINEMWVEYTQKMGITTDLNARQEISNNYRDIIIFTNHWNLLKLLYVIK